MRMNEMLKIETDEEGDNPAAAISPKLTWKVYAMLICFAASGDIWRAIL